MAVPVGVSLVDSIAGLPIGAAKNGDALAQLALLLSQPLDIELIGN
jgi:hypothetical protein